MRSLEKTVKKKYPESILSKMVDLGKLMYSPEKCANVLGFSGKERDQFILDFQDPKGELQTNFQVGIDVSDFEIDTKIYMLAKSGDLKAVEMFEFRRGRFSHSKEARKSEDQDTVILPGWEQ